MSKENKNDLSRSIEDLLSEFQKDSGKKETENHNDVDDDEEKEETAQESEKIGFREKLKKIKLKKPNKKTVIIFVSVIAAAAVAVGAVFGIKSAVKSAKTAYLKPYIEKYPDADFPEGIKEKYCDIYGKNKNAYGYIEISDISLKSVVLSETDKSETPYAEQTKDGYETYNRVIYLSDSSLESFYSTAKAYNSSASGFITYSDFINDYTYKVVGAFYTNTDADDDDGYIFPYNVTEKQTEKSTAVFIDRLYNRFLYNTNLTMTKTDNLIMVSCPTDYHDGFRFVVVGVLRDDDEKLTAEEKIGNIHYPSVIYNEQGIENPYKNSSKWYPQTQKSTNEE